MKSKETTRKVEEQGKLRKLISDYFIQKFFGYMSERKYLETIRYNKKLFLLYYLIMMLNKQWLDIYNLYLY